MTQPQVAPYGAWKSSITSDLIVSETIGLGAARLDGEHIYWVEMRPTEGGRNVIVRRIPDGTISDVTPSGFNVRTRVHEYGGGSFAIADGIIYFSNFADQRLYKQSFNTEPEPITPPSEGNLRYADSIIDRQRERLICVREDHSVGSHEPVNTLVSINLKNSADIQVLVKGSDFYSSPRLSPDGSKLAWLCWNHPNMPWDGTQLWFAEVKEDGSLAEPQLVAGGDSESIFQPEWSPNGVLHFVSDRTNWWNLYRFSPPLLSPPLSRGAGEISPPLIRGAGGISPPLSRGAGGISPLCNMAAEFGQPQWVFGMSTYTFESENSIICTYTQNGIWHLARLDTSTSKLVQIDTPYTDISSPHAADGRLVFSAGSATEATSVVLMDLATAEMQVLRRASEVAIDSGYLSVPQPIEFPTENNLTAHGFFYPPKNRDYTAPEGEKPPLLVRSHGGPTAATSSSFNLKIQYWTSRGFAVLDVNYGGSTGYGREYRLRLDGTWGIVDVDDCANGAKYLAEKGLVDKNRMAIAGGSAGGYTTLCALTFRDTFKAGASYYGVSDLEALAKDTHKFESRYLDRLIGPYPERQDIYIERSPVHYTDRLSCPVIFFQGLEDKVVPPNQAEMMVEVLKKKGLPVAYVPFEGEQHGFRRAENIKRCLDGEFYFYSRVFGFEPAEAIAKVTIANLT